MTGEELCEEVYGSGLGDEGWVGAEVKGGREVAEGRTANDAGGDGWC